MIEAKLVQRHSRMMVCSAFLPPRIFSDRLVDGLMDGL